MRKRSARGFGYEREQARRLNIDEARVRDSLAPLGLVTSAVAPVSDRAVKHLAPTEANGLRQTEANGLRQTEADDVSVGRRRAGQTLECGWCAALITLKRTGRLPRWCSAKCRQRAWEQERAASSGRVAVRIVDRCVLVEPENEGEWVKLLVALTKWIRRQPVGGTAMVDALRRALEALEALEEQERRGELKRYW